MRWDRPISAHPCIRWIPVYSRTRENRWILLIIIVAMVGTTAALVTSDRVTAGEPVTIDGVGVWTLAALGCENTPVAVDQAVEQASLHFRLPSNARQGPDTWYLIRLHFTLEIDSASDNGFLYVSGLTNEKSAALIKLAVNKTQDELSTTVSSVSLVDGQNKRVEHSRFLDITYKNYLQIEGVRPGENVLTFQLERYGGARARSLEIWNDSGIEVSTLAPAKLELDVKVPRRRVTVGGIFTVPFTLINTGGQLAKDIVVSAATPGDGLEVVGETTRGFASLEHQREQGAFPIKALRAGRYQLGVQVRSSANRPVALVEVEVVDTDTGSTGRRISGIGIRIVGTALALFALLIGEMLMTKYRRKRAD